MYLPSEAQLYTGTQKIPFPVSDSIDFILQKSSLHVLIPRLISVPLMKPRGKFLVISKTSCEKMHWFDFCIGVHSNLLIEDRPLRYGKRVKFSKEIKGE